MFAIAKDADKREREALQENVDKKNICEKERERLFFYSAVLGFMQIRGIYTRENFIRT